MITSYEYKRSCNDQTLLAHKCILWGTLIRDMTDHLPPFLKFTDNYPHECWSSKKEAQKSGDAGDVIIHLSSLKMRKKYYKWMIHTSALWDWFLWELWNFQHWDLTYRHEGLVNLCLVKAQKKWLVILNTLNIRGDKTLDVRTWNKKIKGSEHMSVIILNHPTKN